MTKRLGEVLGKRVTSRPLLAPLILALALAWRVAGAQVPGAGIEEQLILENDTVRVALLTFQPGSASGEHMGLDPELGIVLEGQLTLVTPDGREVLGPGGTRWLPALVNHDPRNEGTVPLKLWVVLVKK